ncbi:hypothetical protein GCM10022381_28260 [Leifsonia kafniensis]|uniref:Carboxymuconolactone decarboxylase-like domain-containing protein n=1 Tax=Leifsonia kafniensis TaxID=475957 RepID=A0ABP7KS22_9MICO
MSADTDTRALKNEFVALHGYWDDRLEALLTLSPAHFEVHSDFVSVPVRRGVLDDKSRQLVHLSVAANAAHLYAPGTKRHVRAALAAGASTEEILEVLQLAGTLGIHAMNVGAPIFNEILQERGDADPAAPLSQRQELLKKQFETNRGFWTDDFEQILRLDPDLFEAYRSYSSLPWLSGVLEPKLKEFIYISFDVAATHLHRIGIEVHLRNALRHGATTAEIVEVMEIASLLGTHAVLDGALVLAEALAEREQDPGSAAAHRPTETEI